MSRALDRKLAKLAKHKPNRSTARYNTPITLEHDSFDTGERLFLAMRNGHLEWGADGWQIMGIQGQSMDVLSALEGWTLYWRILAEDLQISYDDTALVRLAKSLTYEKPMTLAELDAAYAVIQYQRVLFRKVPQKSRKEVCDKVRSSIAQENEIRALLKSKIAA